MISASQRLRTYAQGVREARPSGRMFCQVIISGNDGGLLKPSGSPFHHLSNRPDFSGPFGSFRPVSRPVRMNGEP
ncbi:hypothetical protein KQY30_25860 [Streptomyces sp. GMY02]|uniref:hypothetical protein n=1 Tax=Streptomyces sp. GMY02 TaxID=1333528 RepID=UPI001C2C1035|nr:hypothetical protein [Streptomyces sp. GMY02]QXE37134.1 hypothetical protein KQY30_25860 [Streptomyces sp. GMY02]